MRGRHGITRTSLIDYLRGSGGCWTADALPPHRYDFGGRSAMPASIEAGYLDRLAAGNAVAITIEGNTVALFSLDGVIYAIEGCCLRCGACLAEGTLEAPIVACRGCDWRYDVTKGAVEGIPALRLHTFDAKVVDGQIILAIG